LQPPFVTQGKAPLGAQGGKSFLERYLIVTRTPQEQLRTFPGHDVVTWERPVCAVTVKDIDNLPLTQYFESFLGASRGHGGAYARGVHRPPERK
jgi:hypothetical protein